MMQTIAASGIRVGHKIKKAEGKDQTNRRLTVTEVKRSQFGALRVFGTSRGGAVQHLFTLMPNVKVAVA